MKAGRNPGPMYWLEPGTLLHGRESVMFSGLHSLESGQVVFFLPEESAMAIAILVSQRVTREMVLQSSGRDPIQSLQKSMKHIGGVRIVSFQADTNEYIYHGMWLITSIEHQSENQATVTMYNMPG